MVINTRNTTRPESARSEVDPFERMQEGTRRFFEEQNRRLDSMSDKINAILEELRAARKGSKKDLPSIEEAKEEDEGKPRVRGPIGTCEPISVRYAYLDARVRDQAMAGSLPPESLPLLIDPTSPFALPGYTDTLSADWSFQFNITEGTFRTVAAKKVDKVASFMSAIPDASYFMYAWMVLMDLMIRGMPDKGQEVHTALHWYGKWIVDKSFTHTWESICRYHIRVTSRRFAGSFHVSQWYNAVDHDAVTDLVQLHRAKPASGPSRNTKKTNDVRRATNLSRMAKPCLTTSTRSVAQ